MNTEHLMREILLESLRVTLGEIATSELQLVEKTLISMHTLSK